MLELKNGHVALPMDELKHVQVSVDSFEYAPADVSGRLVGNKMTLDFTEKEPGQFELVSALNFMILSDDNTPLRCCRYPKKLH